MSKPIRVPEIAEDKQTPLVRGLLGIIEELVGKVRSQEELIGQLKDEIAVLKGEKARPRFKPSGMEEKAGKEEERSEVGDKRRPGSEKRFKTKRLEIHEEQRLAPEFIPPGSRFKGCEDYVVQDLQIRPHNTRYRLERWQTPEGECLIAQPPEAVKGQHFGPVLRSYILYQYYSAHITQPVLLEQLWEWGVDISSGQIDRILSEGKESFHAEKGAIRKVGLEVSDHITVDDTGARHRGENGYTTQVGNEYFAWFESTVLKDRINFLSVLNGGVPSYVINAQALQYMQVSDDAGQFNVLTHGLCWVHAERLIHRLIPLNEHHREDQQSIRGQIWDFYAELKEYKQAPSEEKKGELERRFDEIFTTKTRFETLNQVLKRLHRNKSELLLVLERPEVPLHTNDSERDIRDYVKKRKVSGGTRSDLGRRCRDTFASLKKTCRKLGISFWEFIIDRVSAPQMLFPPCPLSSVNRQPHLDACPKLLRSYRRRPRQHSKRSSLIEGRKVQAAT